MVIVLRGSAGVIAVGATIRRGDVLGFGFDPVNGPTFTGPVPGRGLVKVGYAKPAILAAPILVPAVYGLKAGATGYTGSVDQVVNPLRAWVKPFELRADP